MKRLYNVFWIIPIFFGGGFIFIVLMAISEELPRFFKWTDSLPLWGNWIIYIIFGSIALWLYKKFEPKEKEE